MLKNIAALFFYSRKKLNFKPTVYTYTKQAEDVVPQNIKTMINESIGQTKNKLRQC